MELEEHRGFCLAGDFCHGLGKAKDKAGEKDTYIHSDVNHPLWHRLIEKHRLSLTPGIPAEQPRHNPSGSQCHDKQGTSEEEPSQCSLRAAEVMGE